jgi:aspartate racemase
VKTVGVIGGMGPRATVDFMQRVIAATGGAERDQDHLHMVVDHDPTIPDRSAAVAGLGDDPSARLATAARRLESAGAELLVMPCNTAHRFSGAVVASVGVPLVDWPRAVVERLVQRGVSHIGLVATNGTIASGVYDRAVQSLGTQLVLPAPAEQASVMSAIYELKGGGCGVGSRLRTVAASLLLRGAECVLVACTDLSAWAAAGARSLSGDPELEHDASQIVAEALVAHVREGARVPFAGI